MIKFDFKQTLQNFDTKKVNEAIKLYNSIKGSVFDKYINDGWVNNYINNEFTSVDIDKQIKKAVEIKDSSSILVVLCESTVSLALKSIIEPLKNSVADILFLGDSLSATNLFNVLDMIKDRTVYLYVISDDLSKPEIGANFRVLYQWLEKKYHHNLKEHIIVATKVDSQLAKISRLWDFTMLVYEDDFALEYISFHPISYIPLYVAGINYNDYINGARNIISIISEDEEEAFLDYVVIRWVALQEGIEVENVCTFEPKLESFCNWRSRLKGNDMIYHGSALYIRDLDNLKYYHNQFKNKLMETFINVIVPNIDIVVRPSQNFNDEQKYLDNIGFNQLNYLACDRIMNEHRADGMFINEVKCGTINAEILGAMSFFFIIAGLCVNEIIEKYDNK